ncbi:MAG: tRNA (adenosine(37)-N6)-threonylcarbamoyltransferase complex dimerization subunit type 1 TsaB [Pseudomonadota bacterium]|nr:MAG: tRNA (adenosine(37)-N6)-threonylcarbamoyltransferase complex dimerization subunit type 1 TsaB [Pseudomonadota bacterium]
MKILALDTATEACSVAVVINEVYCERFELGRRHSEDILGMVDAVLAEAGLVLTQLDAIAFGRGPGLFTGLRIGAGVTQGLAFAADLPVLPVSSLAALAQGLSATHVLAAIDARMNQVYWGAFAREATGLMQAASPELVCDPAQAPIPMDGMWIGAGNGWDSYHAVLQARGGGQVSGWQPNAWPRARAVAQLGAAAWLQGGAVRAEEALPVYIRDDVAAKKKTA